MASNFSSGNFNTNTTKKPRAKKVNRFKPRKFKNPVVKKTPEQIKQEKIQRLRDQIAKLRRKKAELRTQAQQQKKNLQAAEFRAKLDAIDAKITQKMQQMRDTASDVIQKVKDVATAPARGVKRVWDDWEV